MPPSIEGGIFCPPAGPLSPCRAVRLRRPLSVGCIPKAIRFKWILPGALSAAHRVGFGKLSPHTPSSPAGTRWGIFFPLTGSIFANPADREKPVRSQHINNIKVSLGPRSFSVFHHWGKILKGDENGREGGVEGAGGESVGEEGGAVDLSDGVGDGVAAKRISNERNTRLRRLVYLPSGGRSGMTFLSLGCCCQGRRGWEVIRGFRCWPRTRRRGCAGWWTWGASSRGAGH